MRKCKLEHVVSPVASAINSINNYIKDLWNKCRDFRSTWSENAET